jgi:formamidopyrimidine-DNA glycosylase
MPELPEVETVRRGLAPLLEGKRILAVEARRPDLRFPLPQGFAERVGGTRVLRLGRRAKYLLFELDSGETLIAHLGMSGRYAAEQGGRAETARKEASFPELVNVPSDRDPRHDHVVFEVEGGLWVTYNDPRRFGYMDLAPTEALESHAFFAGLGPEPLSNAFNGPVLTEALAGKQTPIKAALLDQRVVAGLGNIYVCEALFRAGVSPKRLAASVAGVRAERLVPAVKEVLLAAIEAGGSTLRDYAKADGAPGYFQHSFDVYGRTGEPCKRPGCGGTVQRLVQTGRSTFFCSRCQR